MLSIHIRKISNTYHWEIRNGSTGVNLARSITEYTDKEECYLEATRMQAEMGGAEIVEDVIDPTDNFSAPDHQPS